MNAETQTRQLEVLFFAGFSETEALNHLGLPNTANPQAATPATAPPNNLPLAPESDEALSLDAVHDLYIATRKKLRAAMLEARLAYGQNDGKEKESPPGSPPNTASLPQGQYCSLAELLNPSLRNLPPHPEPQ